MRIFPSCRWKEGEECIKFLKMKKLRLFVLCILALFVAISYYSCVTESGNQFQEQTNEDANIQQTQNVANSPDFSNSQLLIVPIPFYDNMFHFPTEESFNAVKAEIGEKSEEYKDYFIWRDLNFSSFDQITKITNEVTEDMTETQVNQLLTQYNVLPNEENEVDYKFNLLYKNLLLNLDGLVSIGTNIVAFTNISKSYFSSITHYTNFVKGKSKPLKVIQLNYDDLGSRVTLCSRKCRTDFDKGDGCRWRRLRGSIEIELNSWEWEPKCTNTWWVEGESAWFKRVSYIWWRNKANRLSVSLDCGFFNKRGGSQNECFDNSTATQQNSSGVIDALVVSCDSPLIKDQQFCDNYLTATISWIKRGNSSHSGYENGTCGGTANCNITDCL